jgi:hypothetical protein
MDDSGVGRLLVASLHRSIAEELPFRLEFYEAWLHPTGLRDGRIGLAPLAAVLSFLRQEGDDPYSRVASRAGAYSAEWLVDSLSPMRQRLVHYMPARVRLWLVLRLARQLVRRTYGGTRATIRDVRRERGALDLRGSIFCQVRTQVDAPLCRFYAAAVGVLCQRFNLSMTAEAVECRAIGAPRCLIVCAIHDGTDK